MDPFVVAVGFTWDEYPGLRPGRMYSGRPDVNRRPFGDSHLVAGPDEEKTLCGLPRHEYPYDFPALAQLASPGACATCEATAASSTG